MTAARLVLALAGLASGSLVFTGPAAAAEYAFLAAPTHVQNRVFRVDRATGEMGVCQFAVRERSVGVTLCLPPGEGAGPQEPGAYDLAASNNPLEEGVFRVDRGTGRMSICYVLGEQVLCTPWAR